MDKNEQVKNNLVGFVHDHASSLSSDGIGLFGYLKRDFDKNVLFNIKDPCHGLNLAIVKSLELLDDDNIMKFIRKIHSHFTSPQRKAFLSNIQRKENLPELNLCHYIETRWLSLGLSLKRLLQIWPSLIMYMEEPKILSVKKKDQKAFKKTLQDKIFKLKLHFISSVIEKVNSINTAFQKQSLGIDQLPLLMNKIIKEIAELFIKVTKIPENLDELKILEWKSDGNYLQSNESFLQTISQELGDKEFLKIKDISDDKVKTSILTTFRGFLINLLDNLLYYLPIEDDSIKSLSFLCLDGNKNELKSKILNFNETYKIVPEDQEKFVLEEINDLLSQQITWIRRVANGSSLNFWNLIEQTYDKEDPKTKEIQHRYPYLSKIFRTAHAFAPSSSNVEQCFSVLKLLKSELRNSLKEKTLESLILLHEQLKDNQPILISERLIEIYDDMKKKSNENKSISRLFSHVELEENKLENIHMLNQQDNEEVKIDLSGKSNVMNPIILTKLI